MLNIDLTNVSEAGQQIPEGIYILEVAGVENVPEKEYLKIYLDIADGPYRDYYQHLYEEKDFWAFSMIKSYKLKALPFFKKFVSEIEKSNPGYTWDGEEQNLNRKVFGALCYYEAYTKNDGTAGSKLAVVQTGTIADAKAGKIVAPRDYVKQNIGLQVVGQFPPTAAPAPAPLNFGSAPAPKGPVQTGPTVSSGIYADQKRQAAPTQNPQWQQAAQAGFMQVPNNTEGLPFV